MRSLVAVVLFALPLAAAPVPKTVKKDTVIFAWSIGSTPTLTLFTADGEHLRDVTFGKNKDFAIEGVSPDGRRLVVKTWYEDKNSPVVMGMGRHRERLHLVPLADAAEPFPDPVIDGWEAHLCWTADGKTAYTSAYLKCPWSGSGIASDLDVTAAKVDVVTGKRTELKLPKDVSISAVSPDGK